MLAHVLAAPFPTQIPVSGLGKAVGGGPSAWAPETCMGEPELLVPGSSLARHWPLWTSGSEPTAGRSLAVPHSLSVTLSENN